MKDWAASTFSQGRQISRVTKCSTILLAVTKLVPSRRSTIRTFMRSGLGRIEPHTVQSAQRQSASESKRINSASITKGGSGGRGEGTKAL